MRGLGQLATNKCLVQRRWTRTDGARSNAHATSIATDRMFWPSDARIECGRCCRFPGTKHDEETCHGTRRSRQPVDPPVGRDGGVPARVPLRPSTRPSVPPPVPPPARRREEDTRRDNHPSVGQPRGGRSTEAGTRAVGWPFDRGLTTPPSNPPSTTTVPPPHARAWDVCAGRRDRPVPQYQNQNILQTKCPPAIATKTSLGPSGPTGSPRGATPIDHGFVLPRTMSPGCRNSSPRSPPRRPPPRRSPRRSPHRSPHVPP